MKKVAGKLRLDYSQYRELEAFAQFGSELDVATQRMLARGARVVEVLKQRQYDPMAVERQGAMIYAVNNGFLDDLKVALVRKWESDFLEFMEARHPEVMTRIRQEKKLSDELQADITQALEDFQALQ